MNTADLDYELPAGRIAVAPAEPRDSSRLMVVRCSGEEVEHRRFSDLPAYLRASDLLVVNETRVLPAKLELRKESGGFVPGLFVAELSRGVWQVMLRTRGKARAGTVLVGGPYRFLLEEPLPDKGMWRVSVTPAEAAGVVLGTIGHVPLPPYIEKQRAGGAEEAADRVRYQTVYARERAERGSLAAPTAGLHFTHGLLERIAAMGIRRTAVELDVGLGTFLPVEAATLEEHRMHQETYRVPAETAASVRRQRAEGGRLVVVGTTAVRTLEAAADAILTGANGEIAGVTDLKIVPGYAFRLTDVLITNFHLPRSTLMALVAAMLETPGVRAGAGLRRLKELYAVAIAGGYRFYSYGDAMLILP